MSNIVQKVKDAVNPDKHDRPSASTNAGPHDSNLANKLDPRVDSDRDHRANPVSATGHTAGPTGSAGGIGTTGAAGTAGTTGTTGTTAGPHSSNLANKLDPRVDSDRDHRAALGNTQGTTGGFTGNTAGTTGTTGGLPGNTGGYTGNAAGTTAATGATGATVGGGAGPHGSAIANKLDPRVDSDRDHRAAPGNTQGATGGFTGNTAGTTGTAGGLPGNTAGTTATTGGLAGNTGGYTGNTAGTTGATGGTGSTVGGGAGPHKSKLLNKLDPTVDSDQGVRRDHNAAHTNPGAAGSSNTSNLNPPY